MRNYLKKRPTNVRTLLNDRFMLDEGDLDSGRRENASFKRMKGYRHVKPSNSNSSIVTSPKAEESFNLRQISESSEISHDNDLSFG